MSTGDTLGKIEMTRSLPKEENHDRIENALCLGHASFSESKYGYFGSADP